MKRIRIVIFFSFLYQICFSQNQSWIIASSKITFKIKNAGIMVDGSFSGLTGNISFDQEKSFGNKIETSIDAKSVNTGNNTRDGHLRKKDYFGVDQFPKITMNSTVFSKEGSGKFKGFFNLTLKGTTKLIPIVFSFTESNSKAVFAGSFKLNRLDYKVGESSWVLSNDVEIFVELNVTKK